MFEQLIWILLTIAVLWLAVALWAATIVYVYWDSSRRGVGGLRQLAWILLSLIPMIGFVVYLIARTGSGPEPVRRLQNDLPVPRPAASHPAQVPQKRITLAKPPPDGPREPPTFVAGDREFVAGKKGAELREPPTWVPALDERKPAGQKTRYEVTITGGPHRGDHFSLVRLPAMIGRGLECAIPLDKDAGVSRNHAEIYQDDDSLWVRDLSSRHGTIVNGRSIEQAPLAAGDEIKLGTSRLVVSEQGDGQ